jgi:hypothetical protein
MAIAAPLPGTNEEVIARYREWMAGHQQLADGLRSRRLRVLQGLAVVVLAIAYLALGPLRAGGKAWPLVVGFAAVAALVWYVVRIAPKLVREQRLLVFYERSLQRVDGSERQSGRTGIEVGQVLRTPGHLYERDLDLLGPDSLFGLLCTVRTGPGERGLARFLLDPATHKETLLRQEAVQELLPQAELRERISLLGDSSFQQISASFFDEWLQEPAPSFGAGYRVVLVVTALVAVGLLLAGLTHLRTWGVLLPNLLADLALQGIICLPLRKRVLPLLQSGSKLQGHVKLLSEGLALLQAQSFTSPKLVELQRMAREPAGAVKMLAKLEAQLAIVEQRPKEYFLLFSLLLAAGTQAAISIAGWKRKHAGAMKVWLAAWSEFEALNAVATYAFEHPEDAWPELLREDEGAVFQAAGLGHPLLDGAVRNDISLGVAQDLGLEQSTPELQATSFFLISGSNMAGKSTLLRSIGINAVLAYAGAPVRARAMRLSPLRLGASLALTDSLAEGKSKFMAEVQRLSAIVREAKEAPVLFLVDEIFSGTNSLDRKTAAGAVLDSLLLHGAIGALSTHDLALTELATDANGGVNVHMASPDVEDPLAFDYKLKAGVNTSSNALAIIRLMGLATATADKSGL